MSVTSNSQIVRDNKERWNRLVPGIDGSSCNNKTGYWLHCNKRDWPDPWKFPKSVFSLGNVHHLFLVHQRVSDGNGGHTWKFLLKVSNAIENKFGVLVGGANPGQRLVKSVSDMPDDVGAGAKFRWNDPLLGSALHMVEELRRPVRSESTLLPPELVGTEPPMTLWLSTLDNVINSSKGDLFKSSAAGVVSHVPAEDAQAGSIYVSRTGASSSVLEEDADKPDEIVVLPGTRPCVKVGEEVVLGQVVLGPDEGKLSKLSLEGLRALCWCVEQSGFPEEAKLFESAAHIDGVPLYSGGKGELHEDISKLCDENGVPVMQVADCDGERIFDVEGFRLNAEGFGHKFKPHFEASPLPQSQATFERRREIRSKLFTPAS